jgi:hypothetical protein
MFVNKLCEQTSLHTDKRELHDISDYILSDMKYFVEIESSANSSPFSCPYAVHQGRQDRMFSSYRFGRTFQKKTICWSSNQHCILLLFLRFNTTRNLARS